MVQSPKTVAVDVSDSRQEPEVLKGQLRADRVPCVVLNSVVSA